MVSVWRAYLESVPGEDTARIDSLVHVSQQQREEYEEPEHGEQDPEHHLERPQQQLAPAEEAPGPLVEVPVLSLQQPPLLLQPLQLTLLEPRRGSSLIPGLYLRDTSLDLLYLVLHGRPLGPEASRRSDEAAGEAGEAVAGVEDEQNDSNDVESVEQEQEEVLSLVGLQLLEEPFKLLPVSGVGGGRPVERYEDPRHDQNGEQQDGDQRELDGVTELLTKRRLHVILVQTSVEAVIEIVGGDYEEG